MKITRHIHYQENPTTCVRIEILFNPPYELKSTLGKVDATYPDVDFSQTGNRNRLEKVNPIINQNGLLHVRELMKAGEIFSIELRAKHRLSDIVVDSAHQFELQATQKCLQYVFYIGKNGMVVITGKLVKDDDGFFRKLKADLTDVAMRKYLTQRSLADTSGSEITLDAFPDIMTHDQAAKYIQLSPKTLYNNREIPRLKHNRYRRTDLDEYMGKKNRKR